ARSVSRIRSTDFKSAIGVLFTWSTAMKRFSSAAQMNASAAAKSGAGGGGGDRRSRASAMRSRAASSVGWALVMGGPWLGRWDESARFGWQGLDEARTMRYFTIGAMAQCEKLRTSSKPL